MTVANLILGLSNTLCALLAIALAVPLLRRRIGRNALYGIRFAKSFQSDQLWYDINEYGARRMILWSVLLLGIGLASFFLPLEGRDGLGLALALAPVVIYLIPCMESYRYASRL